MSGARIAMHGRNHLPGGSDPIPQFGILGSSTQEVYLPEFASLTNSDTNGPVWVGDAASYGGGYITRASPSNGDYFSFMTLFWPKGSIWSLRALHYVGPDYGIFKMYIASLGYELSSRPSGCANGKIQDFGAGYGDALNYVHFTAVDTDCYAAVESQTHQGDVQIVVGGDQGDPLTDLREAGNPCGDANGDDPYSNFPIMDGGPGWYRTKIVVDGKNASSTNYRMRISRIAWSRVDDSGGV